MFCRSCGRFKLKNILRFFKTLALLPIFLLAQDEPPKALLSIGNFSVPFLTQIAPLVSFGQTLIGEKAFLPQITGNYYRGHNSYSNIISPNIIYGIRDDLSVSFYVPFNPKSRTDSSHSSGIKDIFLQSEYAFFSKGYSDFTLQATVVANIQFPSGSSTKNPPNGNGSFSYFGGATFSYVSYNWYAFVSSGAHITTKHYGTKFGNSYLYQWGFARYIKQLSPSGWIFDIMIEFNGTFSEKDQQRYSHKHRKKTNQNSGGNAIFVTPSIWLSSKRWIIQWGMDFPLVQNLNGHQDKVQYSIDYNFGIGMQF